jgi:F-type H+-transporting ATPase subunit b
MYFLVPDANPLVMAFTTNVANWVILVILLFLLWNKVAPPMFRQREEGVNRALEEARRAKEEGQKFFEEQSKRIANAEKEAAHILEEAKAIAAAMQEDIREQTKKDTADTLRKIEQAIAGERNMAINQLRSQAATAAVRLAEATLKSAVTGTHQKRLMTQFVDQLEALDTDITNGRNK